MSKIDDSQQNDEPADSVVSNPLGIAHRQLQFLHDAERVETLAPKDRDEIGFSSVAGAQLSLPYNDPGDVPRWQRRNGDISLTMYPALLEDKSGNEYYGYPSGLVPRLLMIWMTTEAVRTGSRKLFLGENLTHFMGKLGMRPTGGKNGSIGQMNEQINRLFGSVLTITQHSTNGETDRHRGRNMSIASEWDLFFSRRDPDSPPLFESSITLSEEFYREIERSFPLDIGVVRALRRNRAGPMALDIYVWLCHRLPRVQGNRPARIPWELLAKQFGNETRRLRDFRKQFIKRLEPVRYVYPEAKIDATEREIILYKSPESVPRKDY